MFLRTATDAARRVEAANLEKPYGVSVTALLRIYYKRSDAQREAIAAAAHGLQETVFFERFQDAAQAPNVDVHGPRPHRAVAVPDVHEQLLAAEHAVLVGQQELQQAVLARRQRHVLAVDVHTVADVVDRDAAGRDLAGRVQVGGSPQAGTDPGQEFVNPIDILYGAFTYDFLIDGARWTAIWYRGDDVVCVESKPWDGGTGGYGYTECEPRSSWQSGEYEVQMFLAEEWKTSTRFSVLADPNTPTVEPTASP